MMNWRRQCCKVTTKSLEIIHMQTMNSIDRSPDVVHRFVVIHHLACIVLWHSSWCVWLALVCSVQLDESIALGQPRCLKDLNKKKCWPLVFHLTGNNNLKKADFTFTSISSEILIRLGRNLRENSTPAASSFIRVSGVVIFTPNRELQLNFWIELWLATSLNMLIDSRKRRWNTDFFLLILRSNRTNSHKDNDDWSRAKGFFCILSYMGSSAVTV